jgi:hypothetical protein
VKGRVKKKSPSIGGKTPMSFKWMVESKRCHLVMVTRLQSPSIRRQSQKELLKSFAVRHTCVSKISIAFVTIHLK